MDGGEKQKRKIADKEMPLASNNQQVTRWRMARESTVMVMLSVMIVIWMLTR